MLHTFELEIIRFIQQIRNPFFDSFFRFLDFFDKPEFFCILIPAIWLIKGEKTGIKLFYLLLCSGAANYLLKALFASPRPFHIDPQVGLLSITGYGLPSGAAQSVMLLSALLLTYWKNSYKWAIVFPYILFVSFARIYLGIHFPTDILMGWCMGIVLWLSYVYITPFLEHKTSKLRPLSQLLLLQSIPLLLLICFPTFYFVHICASSMGIGLGVYFNRLLQWRLRPATHKKEKTLRACIGIFGTFLFYGLSAFSPIAAFFCIGLWVSTGSLLICKKIQKLQKA